VEDLRKVKEREDHTHRKRPRASMSQPSPKAWFNNIASCKPQAYREKMSLPVKAAPLGRNRLEEDTPRKSLPTDKGPIPKEQSKTKERQGKQLIKLDSKAKTESHPSSKPEEDGYQPPEEDQHRW
jgi:hypothetical protein